MTIASVANLVDALRQYRLLEPGQLDEARALQAQCPEPRALARELLQRNWLTAYQINHLFRDRGSDLLLGSYVLLEKLGEGGMGTVYKARNWKLGRLVALKLIRKDRLDNAKAVTRFQREIRAAAQLNHPNIVLAYDADQVGETHFFTMEYVEGHDLARLVRQAGPLDAARACDYIRQTAAGLQHAFEKGVVHRDIKPHNLLLTNKGLVKVLDMGLARLTPTDGEGSGSITQEGVMMGTPDFMAPEQSLSTHRVDIRADLYALGCTLYFLLTGRVPFPGGTLGDKIARHLAQEPKPVEQMCPQAPSAVAAVVRRLMAKKPDARFQTPAEVADALSRVLRGEWTLPDTPPGTPAGPETASSTQFNFSSFPEEGVPKAPVAAQPSWRTVRWPWLAGGVLLLLTAGVVLALVLPRRSHAPRETPSTERVESVKPRTMLKGHTGRVRCVVFAPDGETVASAGDDRTVKIWDAAGGAPRHNLTRHEAPVVALAFASDGRLASGIRDGSIVMWTAATFAEEQVINSAHKGSVRGLAFPLEVSPLFSVGDDNGMPLWDVSTGKQVGGRYLQAASAWSMAFAPDRDYWWGIGLNDGKVLLWNWASRDQHVLAAHAGPVRSVAFSPSGKLIASAGSDGIIKLWDVEKGQERGTFAGHNEEVHCVAFSANGTVLASASADRSVRLWDVASRRQLAQFQPHDGAVFGVAFAANGKTLASCGEDRTVQLWDVAKLLSSREPR